MGRNKHDPVKMAIMRPILTVRDYFPDPSFPLRLWWERNQKTCMIHAHEFEELVVVIGGSGSHRTETGEWRLGAGDVFVVPRGETHGYANPERLELCNVLFLTQGLPLDRASLAALPGFQAMFALEPRLRGKGAGASRLHLEADALSEIVTLLRRLQAELSGNQAGRAIVATGLFLQIVGLLCRAYGKHPHREGRRLLGLERAMARLTCMEEATPSLAELSGLAGMSVSTFQRAWRRYAGRAPNAYLLELRLDRARRLLETSALSVKEVAARAGFADSNYFTRQFRRHFDRSPRAWRAAQTGGETAAV